MDAQTLLEAVDFLLEVVLIIALLYFAKVLHLLNERLDAGAEANRVAVQRISEAVTRLEQAGTVVANNLAAKDGTGEAR